MLFWVIVIAKERSVNMSRCYACEMLMMVIFTCIRNVAVGAGDEGGAIVAA